MSTHIYFGVLLTPEQEKKILVDCDSPTAFQALHKSCPFISWWKARGTPEKPIAAWIGFSVEGIPAGPIPLANVAVETLRCEALQVWWGRYRDFLRHSIGVDLGEGVFFLNYIDTDDD